MVVLLACRVLNEPRMQLFVAGSMRVLFLVCHFAVAGVLIRWKLHLARGDGCGEVL